MSGNNLEINVKVNADTAGADRTANALSGLQQRLGPLAGLFSRNALAADRFKTSISNGDVAIRKWGALLTGGALLGALRQLGQQATQFDAQLAASGQTAGQTGDSLIELGRSVNAVRESVRTAATPFASLLAPALKTGAEAAAALSQNLGGVGVAAVGLVAVPAIINKLGETAMAAINPVRTLAVSLSGRSFSEIHALNTRLLQTRGSFGAMATLAKGATQSLNGFATAAITAAGPLAVLFGVYAIGKTAADLYVNSVEAAAQRHQDALDKISIATATFYAKVAQLRDKAGARTLLPDAQKGLAEAEAKLKEFRAQFSSTFVEGGTTKGRLYMSEVEASTYGTLRREVQLRQAIVDRLTDAERIQETISRNDSAAAADAEKARIDALVAKLSELRDLAADLDFQKLSPQGQYAALGMQIDALKGKLATLPAPDPDSREAVNRHLAQQLDLQTQIAKAEADRARITKQLDTDAKAATAKDLAARQQLQQNILDQITRERELIALREDISPAQKAEEYAKLLTRQQTTLAEVVRLKKEELALAANPLDRARIQAEIDAAQHEIDNPSLATKPAQPKITTLRRSVAGMDAGTDGQHFRSIGEGLEGGLLSQIQQIGTEGDIVAAGLQSAFGSAISGISQGIQGLITGTQTWGQALRNIGGSILNGVISAIAEMFAQWIAGEIARFTLETVLGQKRKAEKTGELALNTANAGAQCVAQMGPWGLAAFAASMVAIMAMSAAIAGSFATGGLIRGAGTGTSDSNLIRVSDQEYVMRAAAVGKYGVGFMDAVNTGALDLAAGVNAIPAPLAQSPAAGGSQAAGSAFAASPQGARETSLTIILVSSEEEAEVVRKNADGDAHILRVVKGGRTTLGLRT
ncbi:hypothetical protein OPIT5_29235 [Opitutaceae bacterium TAV5]|nr:hypothetical protein OPIT5_21885 [Opitutaceae bacterium TAV5]AHF94877.1 hypothetical protein OPIT5_29235 [Opitutaceae bacterium TAV5]